MNKHRPRKRFGQHFLIDTTVLDKIVRAFNPKNDQTILEIGPGTGALTDRLLDRVNHLTVVELDRDLAQQLSIRYSQNQLTVFQQDILNFQLSDVCSTTNTNTTTSCKARVIGNLPYNISTPLLFHLLNSVELIEDMIFMVQKEVALRLAATPGNKAYGRLSVMTALELECQHLFDVPAEAFDPPPKVESSVIQLKPRETLLECKNRSRFDEIVKQAFSQRRKTLRNSLQPLISEQQFASARIDSGLRAETLSVVDYIRLSET